MSRRQGRVACPKCGEGMGKTVGTTAKARICKTCGATVSRYPDGSLTIWRLDGHAEEVPAGCLMVAGSRGKAKGRGR